MERGFSKEQFHILKSVLRQEIGWRWPLLLAACLVKKNEVVADTRWAKNADEEALFASLFKQLIKKLVVTERCGSCEKSSYRLAAANNGDTSDP